MRDMVFLAAALGWLVNLILFVVIAGMAHGWGQSKGKLQVHDELLGEAKITAFKQPGGTFYGRREE